MAVNSEIPKVAILGAGFMGGAILDGLLLKQPVGTSKGHLAATVRSAESLERLKSHLGERASEVKLGRGADAVQIVKDAQVVILSCQTADLGELLQISGLRSAFSGKTVVSVMAGITAKEVHTRIIGNDIDAEGVSVMRVMPSFGAKQGDSVSLMAEDPSQDPAARQVVEKVFGQIGSIVQLPDHLIDKAVGVNSVCHALVLVAVDTITDSCVAEGIPRSIGISLAQQYLRSASSVLEGGMTVEQLKAALSTPKGITLNSVLQLERGGARSGISSSAQWAMKYADSM